MHYIINAQIAARALLRVDSETAKLSYSLDGSVWAEIATGETWVAGENISIVGGTISAVIPNAPATISGNYANEIEYAASITPSILYGVHQYIILTGNLALTAPELNADNPDLFVMLLDCNIYDTTIKSTYYPDGVSVGQLPDSTVVHFFFDGTEVVHELRLPMPYVPAGA